MSGLLRIILIDTHLPGLVELKLAGHTNICGTNASGKTTLQRLIPVFYGEYPSRVVPATRDSFERWYLPRESSFIIYEYGRVNGEICQVVLASSGSGVNYRCVAKAFEKEDYLKPRSGGEADCVTMTQLGREMKAAGVLHSNLLNTTQFRAVIQNDRTALNSNANARELMGWARHFSLCESHINMRHIEKLARAVHSKEGKMETIKAMVASILEEDGVQPPKSKLSRGNVDEWISECQLIQGFEKIRPEFARLEACYESVIQTEQRLSALRLLFELDQSELANQLLRLEHDLQDQQNTIRQQKSRWEVRQDEISLTLSVAKGDIVKYGDELDQIETVHEQWQARDIETGQANLQKLPGWQATLKNLDAQYRLLTEQHLDAESACTRQLNELGERYEQERERLQQQQQGIREQLHQQELAKAAALQALQQQGQQNREHIKTEYNEQIQQQRQRQAGIQAALSAVSLTGQELSELNLLDRQIKEAIDLEDAARSELVRAETALQSAQHKREQADRALEKERKAVERNKQKVSDIEALLYPVQSTLLAVLRREKPDWSNDIGKVIAPALLHRQDLKPVISGDSANAAFFGVSMDLNAIEIPDSAHDEQVLRQRLQFAETELKQARLQVEEAEAALAKCNEVVKQADASAVQLATHCNTKARTRQRTQQEKEQLQQEYQQRVRERQLEWQRQLEQIKADMQQLAARQQTALTQFDQDHSESRLELEAHWQLVLSEIRQRLSQAEQALMQLKHAAEQDKKRCEQWLKDELAKRGVDVDEIARLKKNLQQLKADIDRTEAQHHQIRDYEYWYQSTYIDRKSECQQALTLARQTRDDTTRLLEKEKTLYRQERTLVESRQTETERSLRDCREQDGRLQQLIRQLKPLKLTPSNVTEPTNPGGLHELNGKAALNLNQRLNEGQSLLEQRELLLAQIRDYVDHFDALIAKQSGSGLAETWDHAREESSQISAQGFRSVDHRRLVPHLAQLLNVIVPQKLRGLREQGKIFGADLTAYYHVLVDIDRRIVTQSQRITREVEGELFLDGISESAVRIRSRISELEFWPELKRFDQLHQEWQQDGATDLPGEDYAHCMRQVLDILGRSALAGGGIGNLLDIELKLKEGHSELIIRTDRQLNESSSHGMAYLILCKFLLAFTRLLRGDSQATIHWPIDELGTLHQSNVKKIFDACQQHNICVVGAFPNPESEVLLLFTNRYLIDKASKRLKTVQPRSNPIKERLQQGMRATMPSPEDAS